MDDQRIAQRALFRGEDALERRCVGGVGAQPIDRLGRESDELARAQQIGRQRDSRRGGMASGGVASTRV